MTGPRRILVVWNTKAGRKAGVPTNGIDEPALRALLREHGLGDELVMPDSEEAAIAEVRRAVRAGYECVVGAGGDGTVGLVGRELIGTTAALGILPLGSAMNIARSVGVPRDLGEAADILRRGCTREIDVGVARGDHVFFEVASIGLSAEMLGEAQRVDEGDYGGLGGLVRVLLRFRRHRLDLILDGEPLRRRAVMVAVANAPYTGLGLTLAPHARLDDGLLSVVVYGNFLRWELVRHLFGILAGRYRYSPKVATYVASRVEIRSRRPLPVRADADDLGWTPVEFEARRAALRVVVPETPREA